MNDANGQLQTVRMRGVDIAAARAAGLAVLDREPENRRVERLEHAIADMLDAMETLERMNLRSPHAKDIRRVIKLGVEALM